MTTAILNLIRKLHASADRGGMVSCEDLRTAAVAQYPILATVLPNGQTAYDALLVDLSCRGVLSLHRDDRHHSVCEGVSIRLSS